MSFTNFSSQSAIIVSGLSLCLMAASDSAAAQPYKISGFSGYVVDQISQKPISGAIINVAWFLEKTVNDGYTYLLNVEQVVSNDKGQFTINAKKELLTPPDGYMIKSGADPIITVYAASHERKIFNNYGGVSIGQSSNGRETVVLKSLWDKKTFELREIPKDWQINYARELSIWDEDLNLTLKAKTPFNNKFVAKESLDLLAGLIKRECFSLPINLRGQSCVDEKIAVESQQTTQTLTKKSFDDGKIIVEVPSLERKDSSALVIDGSATPPPMPHKMVKAKP